MGDHVTEQVALPSACDMVSQGPEGYDLASEQIAPDPLGDWFRKIGTGLSDEDYEEGIRVIAEAKAEPSCCGCGECESTRHIHGCFADLDGSACNDSEDHDA